MNIVRNDAHFEQVHANQECHCELFKGIGKVQFEVVKFFIHEHVPK